MCSSDKEWPRRSSSSPRPGHRRKIPVTKVSLVERLAKLEERYAHDLLPEEERLELRERILKLKRKATTLEAGRRSGARA